MKAEAREELSTVMAQVVVKIQEIISLPQEVSLVEESMKALMSIIETSVSVEEAALLNTLPVVLEIASKRREISGAMAPVPLMM